MIAARLDRLSERGRRLVGVGSVIGREFDFALLERAAELGAGDTAEGVEELVGRRILHVVGERLDFTHEQTREVAYAALLAPYRKRLHEATAQALEALHGSDAASHALSLGRHYYASERWQAAHRYLAQAGKSAASRSAHREAAACFEHAIDALRHLPRSSQLVEQIIDLCFDTRARQIGDRQKMLAGNDGTAGGNETRHDDAVDRRLDDRFLQHCGETIDVRVRGTDSHADVEQRDRQTRRDHRRPSGDQPAGAALS